MSSPIMPIESSNTHPVAHILGTCALMSSSWAILTVFHPSPGDNPPESGRAVRKNSWPSQNGRVTLNPLHMHQGSYSYLSFAHHALHPT